MRADRAFYLATLALVITGAGTLALSGHAVLMPVACIPVCVINWYWHFSPNRRYLPDWAATLMCIAATFVTLASLGGGHAHLAELYANVPSAGRLLIFVAWVMLFRRKTPRDYAWLYVISFMMLVCTALLVPEVQFVLGFLALLLLALCAGSLLQVKAEAERSGQRRQGPKGTSRGSRGPGGVQGVHAVRERRISGQEDAKRREPWALTEPEEDWQTRGPPRTMLCLPPFDPPARLLWPAISRPSPSGPPR